MSKSSESQNPQPETISVLLMEGDPGDARLIREMLVEARGASFDLRWVDQPLAGLDQLAEGRFDVILLDLSLLDAQGLSAFCRLEAWASQVPIIALGDLDDEAVAIEAVRGGAQDYLIKGHMDGDLLVRAVCYAIERKRAEEALRRHNRDLALLNQAGQVLSSTLDLDQVLVLVLGEVRRLLGVIASSIWLLDPETGELVCRQVSGPRNELVRGWRLPPGEGIAGWVARHGESLIVPDTWADERHFKGVDQETGVLLRSILSVPLRVKEKVIGVLQVADTEVGCFSAADGTLLELLAASAAIAIDNARLVEALRQRTAELEARNEELDAFAHTAAHDLKAPLSRIVGFAEVMEEDHTTLPVEDVRYYLHRMAQSGRKMSNIIDELLLLSEVRKMEVEMGPLDMASVVAEALQRLAYMIEEGHAEIIVPDAWPVALGYGPWVEEVWVNYLGNAIKYGGHPPRVELGAVTRAEGQVCFWVRDNGVGLAPEDRSRLFKPFTRLDEVRAKGHGLGLSIVRRIVDKLGGEVGVESEVGRGSTFHFTLPAAADQM
jgi:signal transduction histidine kinase/DNA-binding response OmpR family regulator